MRISAREQQDPISSPESIATLERLLRLYKPKHCLEIGTCIGFGTIEIARRITERGGHITSYEISTPSFALAQAYIKRSDLSNITLKFENVLASRHSLLAHSKQQNTNKKFDFIYID
jgi:predicted O-methyltransferase YrrM